MTPDGFSVVGWSKEAESFLKAAGTRGQGFMVRYYGLCKTLHNPY